MEVWWWAAAWSSRRSTCRRRQQQPVARGVSRLRGRSGRADSPEAPALPHRRDLPHAHLFAAAGRQVDARRRWPEACRGAGAARECRTCPGSWAWASPTSSANGAPTCRGATRASCAASCADRSLSGSYQPPATHGESEPTPTLPQDIEKAVDAAVENYREGAATSAPPPAAPLRAAGCGPARVRQDAARPEHLGLSAPEARSARAARFRMACVSASRARCGKTA